jgi:hypothetical protein
MWSFDGMIAGGGKPNCLEKYVSNAISPITNFTWTTVEYKPGFRGEIPVARQLDQSTTLERIFA